MWCRSVLQIFLEVIIGFLLIVKLLNQQQFSHELMVLGSNTSINTAVPQT